MSRLDVQDRVALPPDVRWRPEDHCLEDLVLGARHDVNASAAFLVDHVAQGGWTVRELALLLADRFGLDDERAGADVLALLATLDEQALVEVRRPARLRWGPAGVATAVVGAFLGADVFLARRLPATVGGVLRATAQVLLWPSLALLAGAVGLVVALRGVAPAADDLLVPSAALVLALVVCLWVTTAAHELGHLRALRRAGTRSVLVLRGWRMALLHPAGSDVDLLCVALAGPCAGAAAGCLVASLGLLEPWGRELVVACVAVGLSHLVHLGPWAADGAMLRDALRDRRSARVVG